MKIIKVKGQDLSIPESWEETNLMQWVALTKLDTKKYLNEEELNIEMLSILCTKLNPYMGRSEKAPVTDEENQEMKDALVGFLYGKTFQNEVAKASDLVSQIPIKVFNELMDTTLKAFLVPAEGKDIEHININGVDYAWINGYDNCTLNEVATIKQALKAASIEDPSGIEGILRLLPIILRPATKKIDAETGLTYWELDTLDVKNLDYRKQLFLQWLSPVHIENPVRFFFNGINKS